MVILGSPHTTIINEQNLSEEAAVEIIVGGESEQTILELVQSL